MRVTGNRLWLAAVLVAVSFWPGVAIAAATVTGTVTFDGKAPTLKPLAMDADPACAKKHSAPVPGEAIVLGSGNTVGNILVWVSKGLPSGKTYPVPKTPAVLDQNGCQYKPHVMALMAGQPYKILNSDGIVHNVHALPKINTPFNKPMPATVKEATVTFPKAEANFPIKCDVHPWMNAWVVVLDHPFSAVTNDKGEYTIKGLKDGKYTLVAWQEKLGMQEAEVEVKDGKATKDFQFAPKKKAAAADAVKEAKETVAVSAPAAKDGECEFCAEGKAAVVAKDAKDAATAKPVQAQAAAK